MDYENSIQSSPNENFATSEIPKPNTYTSQTPLPQRAPGYAPYPVRPTNGEPVSVLRWIGRMLIPWIPFVGAIVNFVMLIIWACSERFEATSKNWAIAAIVITLVKIVCSIIIGIILFGIITALVNDPAFQRDLQLFFSGVY